MHVHTHPHTSCSLNSRADVIQSQNSGSELSSGLQFLSIIYKHWVLWNKLLLWTLLSLFVAVVFLLHCPHLRAKEDAHPADVLQWARWHNAREHPTCRTTHISPWVNVSESSRDDYYREDDTDSNTHIKSYKEASVQKREAEKIENKTSLLDLRGYKIYFI